MECEFKLIFEGQTHNAPNSREDLVKVLNKHCGFSRVIEVDQLLDSAPFTIRRSGEREELEVFSRELRKVGARVMIVEQLKPVSVPLKVPLQPTFKDFFHSYAKRLNDIMQTIETGAVEVLINHMIAARAANRQIFVFGNGGSAALSSHLVTDMAKERFLEPQAMFRIQSLNDNMAWFSATANDFGYEKVFVNQLKNLLQPRDLVIAISSSGNSPNVVKAIEFARERGAETWGIVGFDGGALMREAQSSIYIPSKKGQYGYMEDVVSILGHIISIYVYEQDCKQFTLLGR
jgi:D-sedoheptulose 7-phosphate isomerase